MERGLYKNRSNLHITTTALVFIVVSMLTDHIGAARVDVEPNTALLIEGQKTELLCRYGKPINYCRIEIPGEKVLNLSPEWNSKTPGFTYYGSGLQAGQCGVTIDRVIASQNGKVKCSLGVEGEEYDGTIDLVVALRPHQPVIEPLSKPDRDESFAADSLFNARCVVRDGRPAANITWFIDDQQIIQGLSTIDVIETPNDRNVTLSTTAQQMQKYLTPEDDGKMLICRAHHQTDRDQPQEGRFLLKVRYSPIPQPDATVYGLYLEQTAKVNITIRANPTPMTEWTIEGIAIPQGTQNGRYSAYEPHNLGNGYYNVTLAIAGLTLEDTTKTYYLKASNALGVRDYTVRISSSTPPSSGLDIGSIVGIAVAVAILVIIVLLIVFARATGRWCFGGATLNTDIGPDSEAQINPHHNDDFDGRDFEGEQHIDTTPQSEEVTPPVTDKLEAQKKADLKNTKNINGHHNGGKSSKSPTSETTISENRENQVNKQNKYFKSSSDTESADIKTETKSHAAKSQRLPSFSSLFMRKSEKSKKDSTLATDQAASVTNAAEGEQNLGESNRAMSASTEGDGVRTADSSTTGNDNGLKEDKQLVYAELVLKPSDNQPNPSKTTTEYAEIVYVQKPTPSGGTTTDSTDTKGKI